MIPGIVAAAVGIWLMAAPSVIGYDDPAAAAHHIIGPLIVSFAVVAIWQATREVRRLNLVLVLPLLVAPVFFSMPPLAVVNSVFCALAAGLMALLPAPIDESYGGGWRELLRWHHGDGEA